MNVTPSKFRIAIADSHVLVRQTLCKYLEDYCNITIAFQAESGDDLIKLLEHAPQLPEMCIVDIDMPNLVGFETVRIIKKKWPELKILVLSSFENEYTIINALQTGVEGFLPKSESLTELNKAINDIHGKGFYQSKYHTGRMMQLLWNKQKLVPDLSEDELKFIYYSCTELTYKEIADHMKIKPRAIEAFRANLFKKLNVQSRTGLAMYGIRLGVYVVR